jgi:hypothetical protein
MEQQGIDGLHEMLSMWRRENRGRQEDDMLQIIALQPNLVTAGALHEAFYKNLRASRAFEEYISPFVLKRRQAIAERDVRGLKPDSIFQLPPSDESRQMMTAFGLYVVSKAFGLDPKDYGIRDEDDVGGVIPDFCRIRSDDSETAAEKE